MESKEIMDHGLVPPLMFRLYQTIRFNRPLTGRKTISRPAGMNW